jgi:hypothetical protein
MGQLDEAIRAHLELKRKHGASEEELQAEEQEALGPVRREAPAVEPNASHEPAEDPADDYAPAADVQDEPLEELPPEAFHEPVAPLPHGDLDRPSEVLGDSDAGFVEADEAVEDYADYAEPEGALEAADPVAPAEAPVGQTPPRGFDAVEEPAPEGPEENGEDVLEETPDFLQETPEHDRLWFEQKPPRDFDFDDDDR